MLGLVVQSVVVFSPVRLVDNYYGSLGILPGCLRITVLGMYVISKSYKGILVISTFLNDRETVYSMVISESLSSWIKIGFGSSPVSKTQINFINSLKNESKIGLKYNFVFFLSVILSNITSFNNLLLN